MKINDYLKENNLKLNADLASLLVFGVKDIFPNVYSSAKNKDWSDYQIVNYVAYLDILDEDFNKILKCFTRVSKISSFT